MILNSKNSHSAFLNKAITDLSSLIVEGDMSIATELLTFLQNIQLFYSTIPLHPVIPCCFSRFSLFSVSIPQLLYQESLLPFSSHMLSTSILWKTTCRVLCSAADSTTDNVLEIINCFYYFASTLSFGFIAVYSPSHYLLKHKIVNQDIKLTLQSNQLHFPRFINTNCRRTEFFKEKQKFEETEATQGTIRAEVYKAVGTNKKWRPVLH